MKPSKSVVAFIWADYAADLPRSSRARTGRTDVNAKPVVRAFVAASTPLTRSERDRLA